MVPGLLFIATDKPPQGPAVLISGLLLLVVSVTEIVVSSRRSTRANWGCGTWAGRLFAIGVWLLMIFAGIKILQR